MAARYRLLLPVLLLLTGLPGWWVASRGLGLTSATTDPGIALRWDPDNAEALVQRNETERDPVKKTARARAVLAQRPRDGRAYRQLAEVARDTGDISSAHRLYTLAGEYSPRDRWAQAWLADDALRAGRSDFALVHIDQLLRMDAWIPRHLFPVLARLALAPTFRAALVPTMRTAAWRDAFLAWWLASPEPAAAVLATTDGLRDSGVAVAASVRAARVSRALREGRGVDAWLDWADGLTPARATGLGLIVDGGFEQPAMGAFDWQLGDRSAADVQITPRLDAPGQALRISFDGERGDFHDVAQRLLLPPGAYRFSAQIRTEELQGDQGLIWTVRCGSAAGEMLAHGNSLAGTAPWQRHTFDFVVPDDCALQWLALEAPPGIAAGSRRGGTLWIDDVALDPADGGSAPRPPSPQSSGTDGTTKPPWSRPMAMIWALQGAADIARGNLRRPAGPHALVRLHDRILPAAGTHLRLRWAQGCETDVTAPLQIEASACGPTAIDAAVLSPPVGQHSPTDPIQTALRASWASEPSIDEPVGP